MFEDFRNVLAEKFWKQAQSAEFQRTISDVPFHRLEHPPIKTSFAGMMSFIEKGINVEIRLGYNVV